MTSQIYVIGGIVVAFLALWWTTTKIKMGGLEKGDRSAATSRENRELRHVITEMARDKHRSDEEGRSKRSRW